MATNSKRAPLITAALLALLCQGLPACATTQTAQRCGAKPEQPAHRLFADLHGLNHWREYKELAALPEGNMDGGWATARIWPGSDGQDFVLVQWQNQDWAWSAEYCFDKSGRLTQLRYELRTAWGWGRQMEGPFANSRFAPERSEFFSTESEQPIKRPDMAADVGSGLEPKIYRKKSQLPFSKLLSS